MAESKIYKNQKLKLILQTEIDLTGNAGLKIKYITPSGLTGDVTATCDVLTGGEIYYTFNDEADETELNEVGLWKFWAYALYLVGGTPFIPGQVVEIMIYNEGE